MFLPAFFKERKRRKKVIEVWNEISKFERIYILDELPLKDDTLRYE